MKNIPRPEIISSDQLKTRLLDDVLRAHSRIALQAMDFDDRPPMYAVLSALCEKAKVGVECSITFDYRMYVINPTATRKIVRLLRSHGVQVILVGHPWIGTPIMRRSHVKLHVIDDIVYIGGMNLAGESFENVDLMLRYASDDLSKIAESVQKRTHGRSVSDDIYIKVDQQNTLLIDGGQNAASIILDRSIQITQHARRVWYLSQFAPSPSLAKAIIESSDHMVKFNTPSSQPGVAAKIISVIDNYSSNLTNAYTGTRKIHAKILVVEGASGELSVITGSHNFALSGVLFGTKEIAIHSTDQTLARQLVRFIDRA